MKLKQERESKKELRKKCNTLLHEIVVARAGNRCERCGKTEQLQMSHIKPKGTYRSLEYDIDNLTCLCWRCHFHFWHKDPAGAYFWLESRWPGRAARLNLKAQTVHKVDLQLVYLDLKLLVENPLQA